MISYGIKGGKYTMKIKKFFKSAISLAVITAVCLSGVLSFPVYAAKTNAELDKRYWNLREPHEKALASKNNQDIVKTGEAIMSLFLGRAYPENAEKKAADYLANDALEINILSAVIMNVARAYETLGWTNAAVKAYKLAAPFVEAYGKFNKTDETFRLTLIMNKISSYDVKSSVYAEVKGTDGDISYLSAKYEPKNGVIYGESFSGDAKKNSAGYKNASGAVFYVIYETDTIESFDYLLKPLSEEKDIIQIAWNLKNEGGSLAGIVNQRAKIEKEAEYLKKLGTPVLLRFGAEMNVWEKAADPEKYIEAFRFVAKIMKEKAPNVAMVWSVNSISAEGKNYGMFYPGDEYVDWVGVSLYCLKYFKGNKNQDDNTQSIYLTGKFSNPLRQLDPVVKLYGGKKPIMIAEGGIENYSVINKTDETIWADAQMRLMYKFLPIVYPQVKAVFYFNTFGDTRAQYRFTLFENEKINKLYDELTAGSYFIKKGQKAGGISYKKLGAVTLPANAVTLFVYSPYIDRPNLVRTYTVDKKWSGTGDSQKLDLSSYSDGLHTITIEVADSGSLLETIIIYVKKTGPTVTVSDTPLK